MPDHSTDPAKEMLTRTRRIETRLTSLMIQMGYDGKGQKPEFHHHPPALPPHPQSGTLNIPSRDCSLRAILAAIPTGWTGMVTVMIGDDHVTTLAVEDRT